MDEGIVRNMVFFIIRRSNLFSIIKSLLLGQRFLALKSLITKVICAKKVFVIVTN